MHPEPSYWHHPLEDIEPEPDHRESDAAAATAKLFDAVISEHFRDGALQRQASPGIAKLADPIYRRFLALLWVLDPDRYFEGRTEVQVAQYLGFTRAAFSRIVIEFSDLLGIRNRFMKRAGARDVYVDRQFKIWQNRQSKTLQLFLNL